MLLLDVARRIMSRRHVFCEEMDPEEDIEDTASMVKARDEALKQNLIISKDSGAGETPGEVTEAMVDAVITKQTARQRLEYLFGSE